MGIALEIVSPERLLLSQSVDMAVIPGSEGDMGVLEGHAPMIVTLRGGVIALYTGDQVTERLFVMGGFAEVTPVRCTVLATEATPLGQVKRADAESRLAEAQAAYDAADKTDPDSEIAAQDRVLAAQAMIEAAEA